MVATASISVLSVTNFIDGESTQRRRSRDQWALIFLRAASTMPGVAPRTKTLTLGSLRWCQQKLGTMSDPLTFLLDPTAYPTECPTYILAFRRDDVSPRVRLVNAASPTPLGPDELTPDRGPPDMAFAVT
jgi:hypothetical protein